MHIAFGSAANLEIDMPKPKLLLVHCSSNDRPKTKHGQHGNFHPWVIQGGARAGPSPTGISTEVALQLADFGLLVSYMSYFALLQVGLTLRSMAYAPPNRADPQ
jgi:hypothetical protein